MRIHLSALLVAALVAGGCSMGPRGVPPHESAACPPEPCATPEPAPCAPCPPPKPPVLCQTPCAPECSPGYLGANVNVGPGIGGGIGGGKVLSVGRSATWSAELGLTYQDLYHDPDVIDEGQNGKFAEARAGVKVSTNPRGRGHVTGRAGVAWWMVNGDPSATDWDTIDDVGDYLGIYAGVGYEWDLDRHWTTGPEVGGIGGFHVDNGDFAVAPRIYWHLIYNH
jgi:hypothetical protein